MFSDLFSGVIYIILITMFILYHLLLLARHPERLYENVWERNRKHRLCKVAHTYIYTTLLLKTSLEIIINEEKF